MSEYHSVRCDRCKKKEELVKKTFSKEYELPEGWRVFYIDHGGVQGHLCEDCWYDYLIVEEYFMNEEVKKKLDLDNEKMQGNIKRDDKNDN